MAASVGDSGERREWLGRKSSTEFGQQDGAWGHGSNLEAQLLRKPELQDLAIYSRKEEGRKGHSGREKNAENMEDWLVYPGAMEVPSRAYAPHCLSFTSSSVYTFQGFSFLQWPFFPFYCAPCKHQHPSIQLRRPLETPFFHFHTLLALQPRSWSKSCLQFYSPINQDPCGSDSHGLSSDLQTYALSMHTVR